MNSRVTYWLKGQRGDVKTDRVYVSKEGTVIETTAGEIIEVRNGNRIASARRIIRPETAPAIRYKVSGWDMQMNTVRKEVDSMEEAIELGCTMLHARISKAKERRKRSEVKRHQVSSTDF